jgi:hypothetical protein
VEEALNDVIINSTSVDTGERMRITSNGNAILSGKAVVTQKKVEEILNSESVSTRRQKLRQETQVKEILNTEGVTSDSQIFVQEALCHNLISKMIETTTPDPSDYFRVEDVLPHKEINNTT